MISREDRILAIRLIDEARELKACDVLNISQRTLFRWRSKNTPDEDQRPHAIRPEPSNKLTRQEKERIIEVVNSPEYKSLPPSQIVPALADKGEYIASESTMYKVLKEYSMQHHRGLSPVRRIIYTKTRPLGAMTAGMDALSELSVINPPGYPIMAIDRNKLNKEQIEVIKNKDPIKWGRRNKGHLIPPSPFFKS